MAIFDKLRPLKLPIGPKSKEAEDERLVQLFKNRAGLKKAYADLQDDIYDLKRASSSRRPPPGRHRSRWNRSRCCSWRSGVRPSTRSSSSSSGPMARLSSLQLDAIYRANSSVSRKTAMRSADVANFNQEQRTRARRGAAEMPAVSLTRCRDRSAHGAPGRHEATPAEPARLLARFPPAPDSRRRSPVKRSRTSTCRSSRAALILRTNTGPRSSSSRSPAFPVCSHRGSDAPLTSRSISYALVMGARLSTERLATPSA